MSLAVRAPWRFRKTSLSNRPSVIQRPLCGRDWGLAQSVYRQTSVRVQCVYIVHYLMHSPPVCVCVCALECVCVCAFVAVCEWSGYRGTMWNLFCQFPCETVSRALTAWESP